MQARLLLPALWLLSFLLLPVPRPLRAQGRPQGPWRVVIEKARRSNIDDWGIAKEDTTTRLVTETKLIPFHWDVAPDSVRLFLNCENPLMAPTKSHNGQVPVRFSATGATVRLDDSSRQLMIVPSLPMVTLWAYRGKTLVFKHVFKAIPPPSPHIECFIGGGRASSSRHPERFTAHMRAIPQSEFATFMPDDAKYRVSQYQLTLLRNSVSLGTAKVIGNLNLTSEVPLDSAQSGDKLQIDVKQVQRHNFRGVVENIFFTKHFVVELR